MIFWKISSRRRGYSNSPVHSISISEWFLFFPPGPDSDLTEEALDEHEDEDDREDIGLSPASSRGPIFDCFLSLTISCHSVYISVSAKRFFQSSRSFMDTLDTLVITVLSPSRGLHWTPHRRAHAVLSLAWPVRCSVTLIVYRNVSPWPDSATTCDPP